MAVATPAARSLRAKVPVASNAESSVPGRPHPRMLSRSKITASCKRGSIVTGFIVGTPTRARHCYVERAIGGCARRLIVALTRKREKPCETIRALRQTIGDLGLLKPV